MSADAAVPGMTAEAAPRLGRSARGLVAVLAVAFVWATLGLAGVAVAADPFHPRTTHIQADFASTVGLYPQSRVVVQGIDSGWVDSVKPGIDGVVVRMTLHGVALDPGARAVLRLKSMIGERYVEITPAWSGHGPRLASGTVIPRSRTQIPAEISDVLDQFTRVAQGVDKQALGKLVHELAASVAGRHDAIAQTVANFATAGQAVSGQAAAIDAGLVHLQQVVSTLAQRDGELGDIMRSAGVVSDALLAQEGALGASITSVDQLLAQVAAFTRSQRTRLTDLLDTLGRVGTTLAAHDRDFATIIDQLPFFSYGYDRAIDHDKNSWYTINGPMGILFLPVGPALGAHGGVGSDRSDHRVVPGVDNSQSPAAPAVPGTVDASPTGSQPLLPDFGNSHMCVDNGCPAGGGS